jgi:hypothetical protein
MRRRITGACCALAMSFFGTLALAAPSHATSEGQFCFKQPGGTIWDGDTAVQVNTENAVDGWQSVAYARTNASGCVVFWLSNGFENLYVRGYTEYVDKNIVWSGITPNVGLPGNHYSDLGVGIVYCRPQSPDAPCLPGTVEPRTLR